MPEDAELLRQFAEANAEEAFRTFVARHIDFVFAAALRRLNGDAHLAEDVTQMVFADLARKAPALIDHPCIRGWLHRSTHYAAINAGRAEQRRAERENEALSMNDIQQGGHVEWDDIRPVVDSLLDRLNERQRAAVIMRFFEGRSFAEIGAAIRLTEDASRMLIGRSLEKLRDGLARRGITSTTAALTLALSSQVTTAAPVGLAGAVATSVLAETAAHGGAAALWGLFVMSNIKIGIVSAAVVAGLATAVVEVRANRSLRAELGALRSNQGDVRWLQREDQRISAELRQLVASHPAAAELGRLRRRAAVLASRPAGVTDATLRLASSWHDSGRASPEAACETLYWALFTGNIDRVAGMILFRDDTPEKRSVFMARCSDAIRTRYQTPERVVAAGIFGAGLESHDPNDALQFLGVDDHVGGNGMRYGQQTVHV